VLAWIFRRLDGEAGARETPIGSVPRAEDLDLRGLDLASEALDELLSVDEEGLKAELEQVSEFLDKFGERLPDEMRAQHEALQSKLA
jgi:phosphoenolpyruvate carboxykinase (GTP)